MYPTETGIYFTLITGLTVLTIVLVLFVISIIRQQKRRMKEYRNQVIRDISLIEEERKRIAADLHDDLGSILSAARLALESIQEKNPGILSVPKTIGYLDHSIIRLKEISHNLMPAILQQKGLGAAIEEIVTEIRSTNKIKVFFENDCIDREFLPEKSILVFRVIQEILTNILKHANASEIHIAYTKRGNWLSLQINDLGIGFQVDQQNMNSKQFGLQNIRSRLELLDAKYILQSSIGAGTGYQIEIPLLSLTLGHEKTITH
jgi:signal transduction histidine kinase